VVSRRSPLFWCHYCEILPYWVVFDFPPLFSLFFLRWLDGHNTWKKAFSFTPLSPCSRDQVEVGGIHVAGFSPSLYNGLSQDGRRSTSLHSSSPFLPVRNGRKGEEFLYRLSPSLTNLLQEKEMNGTFVVVVLLIKKKRVCCPLLSVTAFPPPLPPSFFFVFFFFFFFSFGFWERFFPPFFLFFPEQAGRSED